MIRKSHKTLGEIVRFALTGVIATTIHYSIYWGVKAMDRLQYSLHCGLYHQFCLQLCTHLRVHI